ncbi:MAG: sigma-54-dependent Fis family transcriptional regulator [Phycisphaerae bacterium]|nr:sigma-54-dependent Fis family transcriptional regulator [Phycisphaerae bacterium]
MSLRRTVAVSKEAEIHELARRVSQQVFMADTLAEASDIIEAHDPDLILFDRRFSPNTCGKAISTFLTTADKISDAPVVVVGTGDEDANAIAQIQQMGAYDYLCGKNDHDRIKEIADRITAQAPGSLGADAGPKVDTPQKTTDHFFAEDFAAEANMVGRSEAIKSTLKMIKLVAASRCNPVLIVGETGAGKELVARAVHNLRHPHEPFVAVNCAALTANLLESELFGHVKGSFTGADREKTGLLELAGAGTIFLDEISEMPIDLQAKLLRVLQEKTFRKVGGIKDIQSNATIIASSNRNLKTETQANRFREDLYYRLNVAPISLAPLRSTRRRPDIPLLAEYFLKTSDICPEKCHKITSLTKLALETLQKYDWPGNVRELRNVIDRAIIYETTDKIGVGSIVIDPCDLDESPNATAAATIKDLSLAKANCALICRALQETGWQKTQAAARLGITRATLYAKIKQYNIEKRPQTTETANPPFHTPEPAAAL